MKKFLILLLFFGLVFAQDYKATIIKPPDVFPTEDSRLKIFLGGSIDMGKAENWQARIEKQLSSYDVIVFNPRRGVWKKEWKLVSADKNFRQQVEWELAALESSDVIVMYKEWGASNQYGDFKGLDLAGLQVVMLQEYNPDVGFSAVSMAEVEEF